MEFELSGGGGATRTSATCGPHLGQARVRTALALAFLLLLCRAARHDPGLVDDDVLNGAPGGTGGACTRRTRVIRTRARARGQVRCARHAQHRPTTRSIVCGGCKSSRTECECECDCSCMHDVMPAHVFCSYCPPSDLTLGRCTARAGGRPTCWRRWGCRRSARDRPGARAATHRRVARRMERVSPRRPTSPASPRRPPRCSAATRGKLFDTGSASRETTKRKPWYFRAKATAVKLTQNSQIKPARRLSAGFCCCINNITV